MTVGEKIRGNERMERGTRRKYKIEGKWRSICSEMTGK